MPVLGLDQEAPDARDVAREGRREHVLGASLCGRAERDQTAVEREHQVVVARGPREVVGGDHDGPALVPPGVDQLPHGLLGGPVHAGEGLVEQEELGVLSRHLSEERALPLPAGQLAEAAARQVVHSQGVHRARDQLAVRVRHPLAPAEGTPAAHRNHVTDRGGEHRLDGNLLGEIGNAVGRRRHGAGRRLRQPHDRGEQGAFSGPVRAEHRDRLSARYLHVDRLEGDHVAVPDRQVLRRQHHGARAPAIRSAS